MKKIILLLFIANFIFGQEESQSQSIELPDFVITGRENISITKVQKSAPDFIPLLSNDFFTPRYPGAEKTRIDLPRIKYNLVTLSNKRQRNNLFVKLQGGLHTLPAGYIFYSNSIGNLSFNAKVYGKQILEYVDFADNTNYGGSLNTTYYVPHTSSFLPGLEISFSGDFYKENNKFYGAPSLAGFVSLRNVERETDNGVFNFSIDYLSNPKLNFGLSIKDDYYAQKDFLLNQENVISASGYLKIKNRNFGFEANTSFLKQNFDVAQQDSGQQYYFNGLAGFNFKVNKNLFVKTGLYVAGIEANTFFSPVVFAKLKVNKFLSFFGEFSPNTEFHTLKNFRNSNRFYRLNDISFFPNVFQENKFNMKFAAKYEYEKYFEIGLGGGYMVSDSTYYFQDRFAKGLFMISKTNANNTYAFINLLFRKGPFGQFYGELKVQNIRDKDSKVLPYKPVLSSKLNYFYDWEQGYGLDLRLYYFHDSYADIENNIEVPAGIDLSANFYYTILRNFKITLSFENILNNKYYYFYDYKAKPFDVLAGFEFKW